MSTPSTTLDATHAAAQDLHRRLSATIDNTTETAQADMKMAYDEAQKLGASIKAGAAAQSEAIKARLHEGAAVLEAAGTKAKASIEAHPRVAAAGLLVGVIAAASAIGMAVASGRSDTAGAKTAPKK